MFKVVVDIDGVIAVPRSDNNYALCEVVPGAREALTHLCKIAHVTLDTARWEEDRAVTEEWLRVNEIPYHKLKLGKPLADVYVDDRATPFTHWSSVLEEIAWKKALKVQ